MLRHITIKSHIVHKDKHSHALTHTHTHTHTHTCRFQTRWDAKKDTAPLEVSNAVNDELAKLSALEPVGMWCACV
jgi:hypothetical protein